MPETERRPTPPGFATRYREVYPWRLRAALRHGALTALSRAGLWSRWVPRELERPRVQFVALHHLLDDEEGPFRHLLELLARNSRLISYSEGVERIWSGEIDRPYTAFSFDDGFRSCLRAARVLEEFGTRGCFFLCPSVVGETDERKVREFCLRRLRVAPMEFLSWEDVADLQGRGHEVGAHAMTHPDLACSSREEIREEVEGSFEVLRRRSGEIRHFAWPFGLFRNFTPAAARAVFDAGFRSCASGERGSHAGRCVGRELCLRRDLLLPRWPREHILYLLARSSRDSVRHGGGWPWEEDAEDRDTRTPPTAEEGG